MRVFVILMAVIFATGASFLASADGSRGLSLKTREVEGDVASATSRCARKITVGPGETACLMQKRKGRA